eukprot:TRINITY_DN5359_c0_g1_i1.p1 TRINITY_DN5359_c0_g1~~TRINITY_DN5359_c0_g1_i1.p1  ORF type:complete len:420 (-),score=49.35 TRINITY_DN5359_c0_g1_i1:11-1270(-)
MRQAKYQTHSAIDCCKLVILVITMTTLASASWNVTGGNLQRSRSAEDIPNIENPSSWKYVIDSDTGPDGSSYVSTDLIAIGEEAVIYISALQKFAFNVEKSIISAVSTKSGNVIWDLNLPNSTCAPTGSVFSFSGNYVTLNCAESPLGAYIPTLYSIDPTDGSIIWSKILPGNPYHSVGPLVFGDKIVVIIDGYLYVLSQQGAVLQKILLSEQQNYNVISSDYPSNNRIFYTTVSKLYYVDLKAGKDYLISDDASKIVVSQDGKDGYVTGFYSAHIQRLNLTSNPISVVWTVPISKTALMIDIHIGHYYDSNVRKDVVVGLTSDSIAYGIATNSEMIWSISGAYQCGVYNRVVYLDANVLKAYDILTGQQLGSYEWNNNGAIHSFAFANNMMYYTEAESSLTGSPRLSGYAIELSKIIN